jgi:uncharacterized protein (TIGR00730 family)
MTTIRNVCVYCGSSAGADPRFADAAEALGRALALAGIGLVFGGGEEGLMGRVAHAALGAGGRVVGVIPSFLIRKEHALKEAQELIVVDSMHQRKQLMFERADAFVALPGGVGTLEELVEQLTWQQLGRHSKPVLLANIDGFWEPFFALLSHMRSTQFIRAGLTVDILKADRVEDVLPRLRAAAARVPEIAKQMAPEVARRM